MLGIKLGCAFRPLGHRFASFGDSRSLATSAASPFRLARHFGSFAAGAHESVRPIDRPHHTWHLADPYTRVHLDVRVPRGAESSQQVFWRAGSF